MKSKSTEKSPIKLREQALKNGSLSLYLDIYQSGVRRREFLKLYIIPERTKADKLQNKETRRQAQALKAQRVIDLNEANNDLSICRQKSKANFIDYCNTRAELKKEYSGGNKRGTYITYKSVASHIEAYSGRKTTFKAINKDYCEGFIKYLKTAKKRTQETLSVNTQLSYLKIFEAVLNSAISDGILTINPMKYVKSDMLPKKQETHVCFLTESEVNAIHEAESRKPICKQAFLFSVYTGLRYSDIFALTWEQLQTINEQTYIVLNAKKTGKGQVIPLIQKAIEQMPERPENAKDTDKVFYDLPKGAGGYINIYINELALTAGIKKHVTFHVARHTHATLLLAKGAKLETISEMLGHSSTQVTQIYAKVLNETVNKTIHLLD